MEDLLDEDGYLYLFRVINEEYDRSKETSGFWASQNGFVSYSLSPFIDKSWSRRENDFRHMVITRMKIDQYSDLYGQSLDADILLSSRYPEPRHFLMDTKTPLHRLDFDEGLDEVNILNDSITEKSVEVLSIPVNKFTKLRSRFIKNDTEESLEFYYDDFVEQLRRLEWSSFEASDYR